MATRSIGTRCRRVLAAFVFTLLGPFAGSTAFAQELDFYLFTPPQNFMSGFFNQFAEEASNLTEGALEISVHPVGELPYKPFQATAITSRGLVQLAHTTGTFMEGEVALAPLVELPGLVRNREELEAAMEAFVPHLNRELERYGVEVLFWFGQPRKVVSGRGRIPESLQDLAGLRVRTLGGLDGEVVSAFGMQPVTMPPGDVPVALQRGVIDATLSSWLFVIDNKWAEQMTWTIDTSFGAITNIILVNSSALARLPEASRAALRDLGRKYRDEMTQYSFEQVDAYRAQLLDAGLEIVDLPEADLDAAARSFEALADAWALGPGRAGAVEALVDVREALERVRGR